MKDYISREAALVYAPLPKHLREYQTQNLDDAWEDGYFCALDQIRSIPAADVRPVEKARFNRVDGYSIPALGYDIKGLECSNCGATYIAQTWVRKFNYCPNCGARMEANDV